MEINDNSGSDLDDLILGIIKRHNMQGEAIGNIEIIKELKKNHNIEASKQKVSRILNELEKKGLIVRKRHGKGNRTLNALSEFRDLLENPLIDSEHLRNIADGLEMLSKTYGTDLSPKDKDKAYQALQHILRGERFSYLRDLLKEEDNNRKFWEKLESEAKQEADRLRIIANNIGKHEREAKTYGSCSVCGPKLSESEEKTLKELWEQSGLGGKRGIII